MAPLRDLAPGSVPALAEALEGWSAACAGALADLEKRTEEVKAKAAERERVRRARAKAEKGVAERHELAVKEGLAGMGVGMAMGDMFGGDDEMDLDEEGGSSKKGRGKKVLGVFGGRKGGGS